MNKYNPKRDSKLYKQVIIAMPLHSEIQAFYEAEAKRMRVGLPTLFYQLLEDRFLSLTGKGRRNIWFPRTDDVPVASKEETTNADESLDEWSEP